MNLITVLLMILLISQPQILDSDEQSRTELSNHCPNLSPIRLSRDGKGFITEPSEDPFFVWGLNYDHDSSGRLLEDYWETEWDTVVADFREMKALGANVVRIHLQIARFIHGPTESNQEAFNRLGKLVELAEQVGLYLDLTGLGCYHKVDVPHWYDALTESQRWKVQALFWEKVAEVCKRSPAIFCYDLMNEPILPGENEKQTDWLAGEFGGSYFVQRITLDLAGHPREQVAKAWIDCLVSAIRKQDSLHLVTIGAIPWAYSFPGAKPIFYSPEASGKLDFVSVHFYPEKGQIPKALTALKVYDVGKPLVIEEIFPLNCDVEELGSFIEASRDICEGYIGFYWGKTIEQYALDRNEPTNNLIMSWLEFFRDKRLLHKTMGATQLNNSPSSSP